MVVFHFLGSGLLDFDWLVFVLSDGLHGPYGSYHALEFSCHCHLHVAFLVVVVSYKPPGRVRSCSLPRQCLRRGRRNRRLRPCSPRPLS